VGELQIVVNRAGCEGHGLCAQTSPDIFELDEEGYVRLKVAHITADQEAEAEAGARVCPVAALTVRR
jgi:ferredoxin